MDIIILLTIASIVIYSIYLKKFTDSYININKSNNYTTEQKVSILIAARNEEESIGKLLTCLQTQDYPRENFEIIIANDCSTDNTAKIIEDYIQNEPSLNLSYFTVENRESALSPKKNALSQAISKAKNEILLLVDADCTMEKGWIKSMASKFNTDVDFVAGFSRTESGRTNSYFKASSLVQKWEFFDFLLMFIFAGGAIRQEKYFSCSGQNLAYRKSAFESVGGFKKIAHLISGDDVNLMQLFRKEGKKIIFNFDKESFTYTRSISSIKALINQRSRWASNFTWQLKVNPEFAFYLLSSFILAIIPWFLLIAGEHFLGFITIGIRILLEYRILTIGYKVFKVDSKILSFYPVWFLLQIPYILIVSSLGAIKQFRWK